MFLGITDSRDYITPFSIFNVDDVPPDFDLPPELPGQFTGLFLPQDAGWFALRRFPPRLVILAGDAVWIVPRKTTRATRIALDRLETQECGRILLLGWIGLQWEGRAETLHYNRHAAFTVERFLDRLKDAWLGQGLPIMRTEARAYGAELDLKFGQAKCPELRRDERVAVHFFHPSLCLEKHRFGFRRQARSAGDLVILSNLRVLWITERHRAGYEPYGTVSRSAPVCAIQSIRSRLSEGKTSLECLLRCGTVWEVPLNHGEEEAAMAFAQDATHLVREDTAPVSLERVHHSAESRLS